MSKPSLSFCAFVKPNDKHYESIASSLRDMLDLADGYGGQSKCAKRILLSIYNPRDFQMSGEDFTGLDIPYIHHAINLLHEHGMRRKNIFGLVESCEERIQRLAKSALHPEL